MYVITLQGSISNIIDENVLQPLLVSTSAITLAAECVRSILKIDDIVSNRNILKKYKAFYIQIPYSIILIMKNDPINHLVEYILSLSKFFQVNVIR